MPIGQNDGNIFLNDQQEQSRRRRSSLDAEKRGGEMD